MNGPAPGSEARHVPVLQAEVLHYLAPAAGQVMVDATVGGGGHARLLAERLGPDGRLIGLDQDATMLRLAHEKLAKVGTSFTLVHENFDRLAEAIDELGVGAVDGVLADLGVCSDQLDDATRV